MLMPMVATMKVRLPITTATLLSMRATISTGSMIMVPNTLTLPAVTMTVMMANTMKLTGSPRKLPIFIWRSLLPKREKSPKLSSSAAK